MNRSMSPWKRNCSSTFGRVEPEEVGVGDQLQLGGQVEVDAEVGQDQAGIDEVGLALDLARSQVGHQAHALGQVHAEQRDLLPLPVAERRRRRSSGCRGSCRSPSRGCC